jgi:hypothetical protein
MFTQRKNNIHKRGGDTMMKSSFANIVSRLKETAKPLSIVLDGVNFSVMLELDDYDIAATGGGFAVIYDNGSLKAEVNVYNESHDTKIDEDDVLEMRVIYEDGSIVEITQ